MVFINILKENLLSLVLSLLIASTGMAIAPRTVEKRKVAPVLDTRLPLESDTEEWYFSRFAITLAPFAEIDLKLLELKIQPYVEIRFDRRVTR